MVAVHEVHLLPVDKMRPNPWNPQKMSVREYDLLLDNIRSRGFLEPGLTIEIKKEKKLDYYRILGGEHRWKAALDLKMPEMPCVVLPARSLTEAEQKKLVVRMNKIRGNLSIVQFNELFQEMIKKGEIRPETAAWELGFGDEDQFFMMVENARQQLPAGPARREFDGKKQDVKTIDELRLLVEKLLRKYGNTLQANYMIISFGEQRHLWIRTTEKVLSSIEKKANAFLQQGFSFDSVLVRMFETINVQKFLASNGGRLEKTEGQLLMEDLLRTDPPVGPSEETAS